MKNCISCKENVPNGNQYSCPNCGATFCTDCANSTKMICPNCYHSLTISG